MEIRREYMNPPNQVLPPILPPTKFDSDDFILHYWATQYDIPYRFLGINNPSNKPIRDLSPPNEIYSKVVRFEELLTKGANLKKIYKDLSFSENDAIVLYSTVRLKQMNELDEHKLDKITGEINNLLDTKMEAHTLARIYNIWWDESFYPTKRGHKNSIRGLNGIRRIISSEPYLLRSPFEVLKITILGYPTWSPRISTSVIHHGKINGRDGLDIFNMSVVSSNLPYIELYTIGGQEIRETSQRRTKTQKDLDLSELIRLGSQKSVYKIYYMEQAQMSTDYFKMIRNSSENKITKRTPQSQIKMTVWGGVGDMSSAPKDSFLTAVYNLDENNIKLTVSKISKKWRVSQKRSVGQSVNPNNIGAAKIVQNRISSALPSINVTKWTEEKIGGHFRIFNLEIDEIGLLDLILLSPLFSPYLYVDEKDTPSAAKRKLYLHFRSILGSVGIQPSLNQAKIKMSFSQEVTEQGREYEIRHLNGQVGMARFPTGTPYVEFSLLNTPNRREAERVIDIVSKIFQYYMNIPTPENSIRLEQIQDYDKIIPGLAKSRSQSGSTSTDISARHIKRQSHSKLSLLKNIAPEIFLGGYATICQQSNQPIPITFEEIPKWVSKRFLFSGVHRDRPILTFPPPKRASDNDPPLPSQWLFVCPNDITPFPGIKKNTMRNSSEYPYVPCCYMKDHMEGNTNYDNYYSGTSIKPAQIKTRQYINTTSKIPSAGLFGEAPKTIRKFLGMNDEPGSTYRVMGMPDTPNTLLDCILTATGKDRDYIRQITIQGKKDYVVWYRKNLIGFFERGEIRTELLKQELYDQSPEQIISGLTNPEIFMDPALYYRILEEIFNINIFVFVYKPGNSKNPDDFDQLEIPRHRNLYVRAERLDKLTVLIYKHPATKAKGGTMTKARCGLIIRKKNNKNLYTYQPRNDAGIISSLFKLFYETTAADEWIINSGEQSEGGRQATKKTTLNQINFPSFFRSKPISYQIVDDYGKLRGLIVSYSPSPEENIIVITPPGQPINLPNWPGGKFPLPELVTKYFTDKVTGASYINYKNKSIDGLWFQIHDRIFGLYCPVMPSVVTGEPYTIGPNSPINLSSYSSTSSLVIQTSLSKIERIRGLRKMNNLILNIVKWLFSISRKNHNMTADDFIKTYLKKGPKVGGKSFSKYNLTDVPYRFPQVSNVNDAIRELSKITSGLVGDNQIFLYSQKYYDSISYFLRDFEKNTEGLKIEIPIIIPGRLMDVDDFLVNINNVIFMNRGGLINWLDSLDRDRRRSTDIVETIDKSSILLVSPYIFTSAENNSFLIQNAYPGKHKTTSTKKKPPSKRQVTVPLRPSLESQYSSNLNLISPFSQITIVPPQPPAPREGFLRALQISKTWKAEKINLGYHSEIIDISSPLPPYILYSISTTKMPIVKEDKSGNTPDPLMIIVYSEGYYAAVLPL